MVRRRLCFQFGVYHYIERGTSRYGGLNFSKKKIFIYGGKTQCYIMVSREILSKVIQKQERWINNG